jgi:hypothetical protein
MLPDARSWILALYGQGLLLTLNKIFSDPQREPVKNTGTKGSIFITVRYTSTQCPPGVMHTFIAQMETHVF